ncbi:hypothetical protein Taro_026533, partial [Colocasia esculenta]|nr:hypothetical protein [Colocasia esculenta]
RGEKRRGETSGKKGHARTPARSLLPLRSFSSSVERYQVQLRGRGSRRAPPGKQARKMASSPQEALKAPAAPVPEAAKSGPAPPAPESDTAAGSPPPQADQGSTPSAPAASQPPAASSPPQKDAPEAPPPQDTPSPPASTAAPATPAPQNAQPTPAAGGAAGTPPTSKAPPATPATPTPSTGTSNPSSSPPSPQSSSSSSSPSPPSPATASPTDTPTPTASSTNTPTPSSKALSPPPPSHSSKSSPSESKKSSRMSGGGHSNVNVPLVVGTIAGVGIFFVLMVVVFLFCCKKKKKNPHDAMHYYVDQSGRNGPRVPKGGGGDYYGAGGGPNWSPIPPMPNDHVLKVPPPPGAMVSPGGGWHAQAPPPAMMSSDMSSPFSGPHRPALPPPSPNIALGFNKSTFAYDELAAATEGFSHANLLGQGGFGFVHKGVLPNGKDIAVKSLKSGSGQGEREFQAEVEIISRVHHRHLVSLVGYCIAGGQRMLVYEFVPNKTLEYHLHGKDRPTMDFPTRMKIALGSAKGLAYLHEDCHPRIIHRDIKAANILIDYNFEAMVADFGLAKLSNDTNTHVSTRVMGTFGYLAPEYASSGKLTEKSDVFSFGVMLLELVTGRRPIDTTGTFMEDSLVDWARPLLTRALEEGNFDELVDPRLEDNFIPAEMARLAACAAASVRHSARRRPKMSQIPMIFGT